MVALNAEKERSAGYKPIMMHPKIKIKRFAIGAKHGCIITDSDFKLQEKVPKEARKQRLLRNPEC